MLAFAARCTSSFPAAFQAVQLSDLDEVVEGVRAIARATASDGSAPDWVVRGDARLDPFFADYGGAGPAALHSFADGGYLDNQPVDLVMETLPKRRADVPVARRILLVDPDPGGPPASAAPPSAPPDPDAPPSPDGPLTGTRVDLLATLLKVVTLPRVQTIGGDVDKILALREPCRVRDQVYAALDDRFAAATTRAGATRRATPSGVAANALRRAVTAREVAEAVARVGFPDRQYPAGSQHHAMATRLVSLWAADQEPPGATDPFLESLDLGFELRRINFLQGRIGRRMTSAISDEEFRGDSTLRRRLDAVYATLAARARQLRFRRPDPSPVVVAARAALGAMEQGVDFTAPPTDVDVQLRALLQPGLAVRVAVDALMADFATTLALDGARRDSLQAVAADAELAALWKRFAAYDEATLPLRDLLPGENDDIEVLRVSPRDTWRLVDDAARGPKLAGTQVHHFGGFFSADWRRNDILWGRLDAAERLISALWPASADPAARDELIAAAHAGIIGDVLRDADYRALLGALVPGGLPAAVPDGPVPDAEVAAVIAAIKENYRIPPPPDAQARVELATRAARVADGVAKGLPATPGPLAPVRTWAGRIVHVATSLVELALPNRVSSILGRHLLDVALIAGVLIIALGGLVGGPGVTSFGWVVVLTVLGVRLVLALLRSWLAHGQWKLGVGIAGALVVAVVVYGLVSWSGWPRAVAFLAIGLAVGLLLGALPVLLHRRQRTAATPVVAAALAVVVLVAVATAAVGHGRNDVADRVCRLDDSWWRTVAERVVVVSCGE